MRTIDFVFDPNAQITNKGCVPFNQAKSGFCDRKFYFPFHLA